MAFSGRLVFRNASQACARQISERVTFVEDRSQQFACTRARARTRTKDRIRSVAGVSTGTGAREYGHISIHSHGRSNRSYSSLSNIKNTSRANTHRICQSLHRTYVLSSNTDSRIFSYFSNTSILAAHNRHVHQICRRCFATRSSPLWNVSQEAPNAQAYLNSGVIAGARDLVDVKKVLVIGSGGLAIGQAGEFDYSGGSTMLLLKHHFVLVVVGSYSENIKHVVGDEW